MNIKREQISIGDKIKIKDRIFEIIKIGKSGYINKKGNVRDTEEFELKDINQKGLLPIARIEWFIKENKIVFYDRQELKERDIKRSK